MRELVMSRLESMVDFLVYKYNYFLPKDKKCLRLLGLTERSDESDYNSQENSL